MKTALITGSTRGIGWAMAQEFAKKGYHLGIHGICDEGDSLAKSLESEFSIKAYYFGHDLSDATKATQLVVDAEKKLGRIDVLVNNAGLQFVAPIVDYPAEKWHEILAINLTAAFFTTRAAWKGMAERKFGRIINISSVHGMVASEFKSAYVASKHGLMGLSKVTALEGAPFNITCNTICPGYVKTPMVESQIANQAKLTGVSESEVIEKVLLAKHAIKDFVTAEDLAAMVMFLASDHGKLITGASFAIDGGWTTS